jgi:phage terminase large subunit
MSTSVDADFPEKLRFLFAPARYKVLHGGRGGAKSWGVARALLILGTQRPMRILCAREFQKSIKESVKELLDSQIRDLGLSGFYQSLETEIRGKNGTGFLFAGLHHNVTNIKSVESVDVAWVEEAQTVSKSSWETLIPTIRKNGSEIWLTFNPQLETDDTYQRFVVNPPTGAIVEKINWSDNPWFPEVLAQERDDLKARDPDAYLNVWEGNCRTSLDGAIYARELRQAQEENRITRVPYDSTIPVAAFFDLGWADNTSIWFAQTVGNEFRVIDFYQNSQLPAQHYATVLQNKGYMYGSIWLPHDAQAKSMTGRSTEEVFRGFFNCVQITPKLSIADGIQAARTIFNRCWFDETKCAEGIQNLRHYRYDVDPDTKEFSRQPLHDIHSHAADSFRYLAVGIQEHQQERQKTRRTTSWLG